MNLTFRTAKTLAELSGWRLSNLSLQKLVYFCHMVHLGLGKGRLVKGHFEAWDMGPVEPELYRRLKAYGSSPVPYISNDDLFVEGTDERKTIEYVYNALKNKKPAELIAMTHRGGSAWAKHYVSGVMGIVIPDTDIEQELHDRFIKPSAPLS